jgi:regulator of sigma E protease
LENILNFLTGQLPVFLVVIGVVVTIHELGHFLAAKICGVGVLKFSVGFGPAIFKKEVSGTEYRLSIIPLGGYVRMVGDMPDMITGTSATDSSVREEKEENISELDKDLSPAAKALIADKSKWFLEKSTAKKAFIVFAGPLFNYLLAIFILCVSAFVYGVQTPDGTKVGAVAKGSPAERIGIKAGDRILKIDGTEVNTFEDIQKRVQSSNGQAINVLLARGDSKEDTNQESVSVIPESRESKMFKDNKAYMVGISAGFKSESVGILESISKSFSFANAMCIGTLDGMLGLFMGAVPLDSVGGPILIFEVASQKAEQGINSFLLFLAYLNISLGVLNLLPIPVLDGGHLLIFAIESILGPISLRKKEIVQGFGMAFLLGFMLLAVKNDLTRDKDFLKPKEEKWSEESSFGKPAEENKKNEALQEVPVVAE